MMITKILIGIDDSKYADNAAAYGFNLAHKFNAAVGVVNIVEPMVVPEPSGIDPLITSSMPVAGMEELEIIDIQKNQAENMVGSIIKKYAEDTPVTQFFIYGSPADGIISCSKEFNADLIVIGTHNRTGFDRLISGSVAEEVVRHSTVPVLVVPTKSES